MMNAMRISGYSLLGYEISAYELVCTVPLLCLHRRIIIFNTYLRFFFKNTQILLLNQFQQNKEKDQVDQFHCLQIGRRGTQV